MDHNDLVYETKNPLAKTLDPARSHSYPTRFGATQVTISMRTRQFSYSFWHGVSRFNQKFRGPELSYTRSTPICSRNLQREILDCFAIVLENGCIAFFLQGPFYSIGPQDPGRESLSNSYPYLVFIRDSAVFAENQISQSVSLEIPLITTDRAGILLTQPGVVRLFRYNCNIRNPYYVATNGQST